MILAWLSLLDAIVAIAMVVVGIVGAHIGTIEPMAGFSMFLLGYAIAVLALLIGLVAIWRTSAPQRRVGRPKAVAGIIISLVIIVPVGFAIWRWMSMPYPPINDITTDYANPPQFAHPPGLKVEAMQYDRGKFEHVQESGYSKLPPLELDERPDDAFAKVKAAANTMPGWQIVYTDPATHTIEGIETSRLFRFVDDFVIQVRPGPNANTSLVEMRSRSRDGTGDFGVNYRRIRGFFTMLQAGGSSTGATSASAQ
jgi:uncharacterized protein (DUF1499 family)